ncbi:zinc finger protein 865 [Salmo salar]|uniref:Zinc finger protein 865 n=1 Tax=Salmo salar TaxID=8030 RepID=A0A1S3M352_SALSA|nr:zinc finger protein 865 [Salmo salar]|eukprot:XP_013997324.1 PREDICTED: zinc finger protein 865-like [Salmo salar]
MFQFSKYPLDILDMLSGHQAHQFKGLGLERQFQHQQQVQLQHQQQLQQQHQQQGESSGALLSGLGLGSLQGSRSNAFADSSSIFAKMSAPPPPISHQSQSSSSHSSRKSSKMSSSVSGSSAAGYPQFLRPFHPAEAALAQEQLHSGMGRFDFGGSSSGGSGVIGGVVTSAPPPPPLHPGLSVPQASPGPSSSSPSPSASSSASNNPGSAVSSLGQPLVGQSDPRSLHQQFSCMLAANQYFLSGVPTNSSLEQFLVQQGGHNHLGLGLGQGASDSSSALAPPPALHSSHSHSHSTPQPQQQQQPLAPHALSHSHSHTHPHHPLHPTPQPSSLGGFDFQGIPVLSSNQLASLMQQEASGMPLPLPLHLSLSKDEGKGDSGSGGSGGSRRKKAMAGYLPQRKADGTSHSSSSGSNCHSSSTEHSQNSTIQPGLVGGAITSLGGNHSSVLSSTQQSSSTVSSSSSAPSSSTASVLVANDSQLPKPENLNPMASMPCQPDPEAIYHCGECGKTFSHLTSLRRHLRSHGLTSEDAKPDTSSEDKTFCCTECGKGFKKRGHLLQHGVIHSGARPFACGVCQRSFNRRESLTRHEKIHDDKPFRCPACGRCFRESTSLLNHAASGTCGKPGRNSRPRPSGSGENQSSSSASSRKTGMEAGGSGTGDYQRDGASKFGTDYSRNRPSYQPSYSVDDYRRQQANPSCYSGESSHGSGISSQTLRKAPLAPTLHPHPQSQQQHHLHQQQPHLPLSSLLDDSEDEVTSSAMSAIAAAAAASCEISTGESRGEERRDIIGGLLGGLGFGNMGVSPGGPSSTSEIDKTYRSGSGSTIPLTHPSQQMMNAKPKKPRKPRQKREPGPDGIIVRQRRSRGEGERPYSCGVCGKGFRRRETLRRHDRVHTGEKPHRCDVCGKEFREYFHLTKHSTVHSGQKNYKCDLCGKEFAYAQSLVRHGKLHTKVELDGTPGGKIAKGHGGVISLDGNQANSQSYYPYPQDKSQGSSSSTQPPQPTQKLFTCTTCWKSFRHQFHLTAHQQTVHGGGIRGEKNFCCEVCGKAFAYSNSLSRHRQSQHGLGRTGSAIPPASGTQHPSQADQYIPLFESGHPLTYPSGSYMPNQSSQGQHRPFQFQSQEGWVGGKRKREKKRRVEYQSIMRGGQLVGVALNKATSRRLKVMKRKKGIMHEKLKQKKLLAQLLRMRGGYRVRQWCGGVVKVSGLSSMEVPIKRFPCQYCPSTTFASQAKLLLHRSVRHPPRNNGHQARLKCSVCGKRSRTLRKALIHRGRHLSQGRFSCPKCRSRFWNGSLLERHSVACQGQSMLGSGNWALKVNLSPREVVEKTAEKEGQGGLPGRTTVVTEYSH